MVFPPLHSHHLMHWPFLLLLLMKNVAAKSWNKNSMSDHSLPRHDSKGKLKTLRAHRHYLTQPDQISKEDDLEPVK